MNEVMEKCDSKYKEECWRNNENGKTEGHMFIYEEWLSRPSRYPYGLSHHYYDIASRALITMQIDKRIRSFSYSNMFSIIST